MNTVADSSVLVAALIEAGPNGTWAEEILANGALYAPELVQAEATNILRRLEGAKLISTPEANAAQHDLMRLAIELLPFEPFAERIWALRHNMTSHDAWYVAIAEALALPLATLDRALSRSTAIACVVYTPPR